MNVNRWIDQHFNALCVGVLVTFLICSPLLMIITAEG